MARNFGKYLTQLGTENFQEAPIAPEVAAVVDAVVEPQPAEVVETPVDVTPAPVDSFGSEPIVEEVQGPAGEVGPLGEAGIVTPEVAETIIEQAEIVEPVESTFDLPDPAAAPIDAVSQAQVERQVIEQQADDLIETQHALEAYSDLLGQARGEISQQTAAFLNVGIKQVERILGTNKVSVGLESYNAGPRSDIMRAQISVEDIKEYATKAFEKLKELIKKLVAAIIEGVENLMSGITVLDSELQKLKERVGKTKEYDTSDRKITITNPWSLFADGKIKLYDTKGLTGLAHFSTYAYPKAVKSYYEELAKIVSGYNVVSGDADATVERIETSTAPLDDLYSDREIFPGNYKIEIAADGIVYGIGPADHAKPSPDSVAIRLRHTFELKEDMKKLEDIVKILKAARDEHTKIKAGADSVIKAVEKLEKASQNPELDASSVAGAKKVANAALKLVRQSNPRSGEIIKYITRILRTYVAVFNRECAEHDKTKTGDNV